MSLGSLVSAEGRLYGRDGERPAAIASTVAAVGLLTALAAVLRFAGLGHQGLWFDESNTAMLVRFSPGKMLGLIPQTESTPPLYYCVAWVWVRVFGDNAAGLRSLSAVAGTATVPLAYAAASTLVSRRAGLICAALTACNPFLIWYSQEARSYSLLVALSAAALAAFAAVHRRPTPLRLAAWVLAAGLSLATHYFAAVLVVPEAVWLAAEHGRRRAVALGVGIVAACGAGLVPLAISQNGTGNDAWIAHSPLGLRLAQILPQLLIGTGAPARTALKFAAFALAVIALALLAARARGQERRGALLAGGLAVAGFAIALALIACGFDDVITRNLIELWLPLAILASGGLAAAAAPRAGALVAAGLCAIGLTAAVGVAATPRLQRPDWPGVAAALGRTPPPGQARAILIQRYRTLLPLSLYLPHLTVLRRPIAVSQLDVIAMRSPSQPLCWWGAECNLFSSRIQRRYAIPGLRPDGTARVAQFRIKQLRAAQPVRLSPAAVARALHSTKLSHDILLVQRRA